MLVSVLVIKFSIVYACWSSGLLKFLVSFGSSLISAAVQPEPRLLTMYLTYPSPHFPTLYDRRL